MTKRLGAEEFDEMVIKGKGVALVDFYADWCGPCKMMSPIVDTLAADFEGRAAVYKVDTDACGALAAGLGIFSIPTLILFQDGVEKERIVGMTTEPSLRAKLEALC